MTRSMSHKLRVDGIKARQTEQKRINARRTALLAKAGQKAA